MTSLTPILYIYLVPCIDSAILLAFGRGTASYAAKSMDLIARDIQNVVVDIQNVTGKLNAVRMPSGCEGT